MVQLLPRHLVSYILNLCPVPRLTIELGLSLFGATKPPNVPPGISAFSQSMDSIDHCNKQLPPPRIQLQVQNQRYLVCFSNSFFFFINIPENSIL